MSEETVVPPWQRAEAAERDRLVANVTLASVSKALELTEAALASMTAERDRLRELLKGSLGELHRCGDEVECECFSIYERIRAALAPSEEVTG